MCLSSIAACVFVCTLLLHVASAAEPQQCAHHGPALWYEARTDAAAGLPAFPTGNRARAVTGRELHELLLANEHGSSGQPRGLVVLFYLAGDPPSVAMTPVFKCLPAFFSPEEVQFVLVPYAELSLMTLVSQGLHALPVLQVNVHGRRYRYSGKHRLGPMLQFLARALAVEPAASLDVARFCSSGNKLPAAPADAPFGTCRPRGLITGTWHTPAAAAAAGSSSGVGHVGSGGVCDQHGVCSRPWQCSRWDGEVTLQELQAQPPRPHFYLSVVFLVLRLTWVVCKWCKRRCTRRPAVGAAAAMGAAAAAVGAAPGGGASAAAPGTSAAAAPAPGTGTAPALGATEPQAPQQPAG